MRVKVPRRTEELLVNPGKGWVAYGLPQDHSPDILKLCSIGYKRFEWAELNPGAGIYNWGPIDRAISAWRSAGKQFAFGVVALSSHSRFVDGFSTPKWVFERGAKGSVVTIPATLPNLWAGKPGPKMVPDFSDPIFQRELSLFYEALAARYDGSRDLAFIDVRTYGNWGEGHLYPFVRLAPKAVKEVDPTTLRTLIGLQTRVFKRTQLIVPWGAAHYQSVYADAVRAGMGL